MSTYRTAEAYLKQYTHQRNVHFLDVLVYLITR